MAPTLDGPIGHGRGSGNVVVEEPSVAAAEVLGASIERAAEAMAS